MRYLLLYFFFFQFFTVPRRFVRVTHMRDPIHATTADKIHSPIGHVCDFFPHTFHARLAPSNFSRSVNYAVVIRELQQILPLSVMFACRIGNAIVSVKITPTADLAAIYMYFFGRNNTLDTFVSYESRVRSRLKRDCPYNDYITLLCPDKLRTGRFCPVLISLFPYSRDVFLFGIICALFITNTVTTAYPLFCFHFLFVCCITFFLMPKCKYTFVVSLQSELIILGNCQKFDKCARQYCQSSMEIVPIQNSICE